MRPFCLCFCPQVVIIGLTLRNIVCTGTVSSEDGVCAFDSCECSSGPEHSASQSRIIHSSQLSRCLKKVAIRSNCLDSTKRYILQCAWDGNTAIFKQDGSEDVILIHSGHQTKLPGLLDASINSRKRRRRREVIPKEKNSRCSSDLEIYTNDRDIKFEYSCGTYSQIDRRLETGFLCICAGKGYRDEDGNCVFEEDCPRKKKMKPTTTKKPTKPKPEPQITMCPPNEIPISKGKEYEFTCDKKMLKATGLCRCRGMKFRHPVSKLCVIADECTELVTKPTSPITTTAVTTSTTTATTTTKPNLTTTKTIKSTTISPSKCSDPHEWYVDQDTFYELNCNYEAHEREGPGCVCAGLWMRDTVNGNCVKGTGCAGIKAPKTCGKDEILDLSSTVSHKQCSLEWPLKTKGPACRCRKTMVRDENTGGCSEPGLCSMLKTSTATVLPTTLESGEFCGENEVFIPVRRREETLYELNCDGTLKPIMDDATVCECAAWAFRDDQTGECVGELECSSFVGKDTGCETEWEEWRGTDVVISDTDCDGREVQHRGGCLCRGRRAFRQWCRPEDQCFWWKKYKEMLKQYRLKQK